MNKPTFTKFHGSVFVIVLIILATAFLLQMYGTVERRDLAGLATEPTEQESIEDLLENGGTVEITYGTKEYTIVYDQTNRGYELQQPGATAGVIISRDFSSYDAVLQDIAKNNLDNMKDISLVAYGEEEIVFSEEVRLTDTSINGILNTLQSTTDTIMDEYNEYYYPELYPTSEQEVTEEPAPEEEADTGDTGDSGRDETGDTGAEETGETAEEADDTAEIAQEETAAPAEAAPEAVIEEPEEIIISYKDALGNEYSWGAVTYDGTKYTIEIDGEKLDYLTKEDLLKDLQNMLEEENALSVSFEQIKEGKSVATTASLEKIDDLKKVLEGAEEEVLPEKAPEAKAAGTKPTDAGVGEARISPTISLDTKGALKVGESEYVLIKGDNDKIYAATTITTEDGKQSVYIDLETGKMYDATNKELRDSTVLTEDVRKQIKDSEEYKKWEKAAEEIAVTTIFAGKKAEKKATVDEIKKAEDAALVSMGISQATVTDLRTAGYSPAQIKAMYEDIPEQYRSSITAEMWTEEKNNINTYLKKNYPTTSYSVSNGHYSGKIDKYEISWNGDDMGVKVAGKTIYQTTDKSGKTIYYTCPTNDCSEKTEPEAETKDLRKTFRQAEKAEDKLAENVAENGKLVDENGNEILDKDGKPIPITTLRQAAYRQALYDQQEAQVKGILSGWLSNFLDKGSPLIGWGGLGGWSRGVPAGICANILGLEYYKEDGWTRVPMNSSAEQLQSQLIANSRTVIIEGEKEEITESLYRYAYTLRLLANQSVEWQTYLYNSCSQETSTEVFYDYGALATGAYYSFHYAGAGAEDMIFDCEQEECLFDQACVAFTDSSAPVCVSLVHGAGFETPNAGSDYDCI